MIEPHFRCFHVKAFSREGCSSRKLRATDIALAQGICEKGVLECCWHVALTLETVILNVWFEVWNPQKSITPALRGLQIAWARCPSQRHPSLQQWRWRWCQRKRCRWCFPVGKQETPFATGSWPLVLGKWDFWRWKFRMFGNSARTSGMASVLETTKRASTSLVMVSNRHVVKWKHSSSPWRCPAVHCLSWGAPLAGLRRTNPGKTQRNDYDCSRQSMAKACKNVLS